VSEVPPEAPARVTYLGTTYEVSGGRTVLEALLEGGAAIPHACRAGACGACIVQATAGEIPEAAQRGLRETWKARGYLYACQCRPTGDLALQPLGEGARASARVVERSRLSPTVTRLWIQLEQPLPTRAGQYLTVARDGVVRSYSIAAQPVPGLLELHVRHYPGGQLSPYLCERAQPGDALSVQGPLGDCVYEPGRPEQPLVLAGTGTGLAPLWGILHDALAAEHTGPIHLFHGAVTAAGLYLMEELSLVTTLYPNVRYVPCVLRADDAPPGVEEGALDKVIGRHLPKTAGMRAFVCGDAAVVTALKKRLFLSGTALRDIAADSFLPAAPPAAAAAVD
jgi:CDP-4-dehydro-6-deoxyglucose reductase, E3